MMTVCACVCVCDVHCGVSQLGAMGPLAGLSFVSSWDGVFHSSAPLPWPKHTPVSSPTLLLLLLLLMMMMLVGAACSGACDAERVCGLKISQERDTAMHALILTDHA